MLYAIIAQTAIWIIDAHSWNVAAFGIVPANEGMLKTLMSFHRIILNEAECFYFNQEDTLALRDI